MPLDTCITNVGEYYSAHYLDSTFSKDVKDLISDWAKLGSAAPPKRLQSLSTQYFLAKTQALDEEDPALRSQAGKELQSWHSHLLQALGYSSLQPADYPTEAGDSYVPILGEITRYNRPWLVICETHFCLPDASLKEGRPSEDPLGMEPSEEALMDAEANNLCEGDWARCIGKIFTEEDAPRFVLFLAGSQVLLLDRDKFAQGRF